MRHPAKKREPLQSLAVVPEFLPENQLIARRIPKLDIARHIPISECRAIRRKSDRHYFAVCREIICGICEALLPERSQTMVIRRFRPRRGQPPAIWRKGQVIDPEAAVRCQTQRAGIQIAQLPKGEFVQGRRRLSVSRPGQRPRRSTRSLGPQAVWVRLRAGLIVKSQGIVTAGMARRRPWQNRNLIDEHIVLIKDLAEILRSQHITQSGIGS